MATMTGSQVARSPADRFRDLAGLHLKDWPKGIFVSQRALDFHFPHSHT
jgi:hypothetical protein